MVRATQFANLFISIIHEYWLFAISLCMFFLCFKINLFLIYSQQNTHVSCKNYSIGYDNIIKLQYQLINQFQKFPTIKPKVTMEWNGNGKKILQWRILKRKLNSDWSTDSFNKLSINWCISFSMQQPASLRNPITNIA